MSNYNIFHANTLKLPSSVIYIEKGDRVNKYGLVFFGSASTEYAEDFWENTLRLLENFAKNTSPQDDTEGQTWYDTSSSTLYVSTVTSPHVDEFTPETRAWRAVGRPYVSDNTPTTNLQSLWHKPTAAETLLFNGTNYEDIGIAALSKQGGIVTGDLTLTGDLSFNVWSTSAGSTVFSSSVIITSNLTTEIISQTGRGTVINFDPQVINFAHRNVDFVVGAANNISIGYNSSVVGPRQVQSIFSSSNASLNVPLNINNRQMSVGTQTTTGTDALTYQQYLDVLNTLIPQNFLRKDGSNEVAGLLSSSATITISSAEPRVTTTALRVPTNESSSAGIVVNSSSLGSTGGIAASMHVNNVSCLSYDSDYADVIRLQADTVVRNVQNPSSATDGATVNYTTAQISVAASLGGSPRRPVAWAVVSRTGVLLRSYGVLSCSTSIYGFDVTLTPIASSRINITTKRDAVFVSSLFHVDRDTNIETDFIFRTNNTLDIIDCRAFINYLESTASAVRVRIYTKETQNAFSFGSCDDLFVVENVNHNIGSTNFANSVCVVVYSLD